MQQVYLDNHSSTKLDARVYEAMLPFLKDFYGNPQSLHSFGYKSYQAIENARNQLAQLINAQSEEIIFTSCGSEAN
ncbi:MAG: aminotransferase class V-fold PLP-dependent enzyme, partial [candidate division WOR-3 bacterium]